VHCRHGARSSDCPTGSSARFFAVSTDCRSNRVLWASESSVREQTGAHDLYRIRPGDYRVIYRIVESRTMVDVIAVRHRSDAYR
jgi:hypothetical protein